MTIVLDHQKFADTRPALRGMDVARAFAAMADYPRPRAGEPEIPAATPTEIDALSRHTRTEFIEQAAREFAPQQQEFIRWPAAMEQLGEFSPELLQQSTGACRQSIHAAIRRALANRTIERTGLASYRWIHRIGCSKPDRSAGRPPSPDGREMSGAGQPDAGCNERYSVGGAT